MPPPLPTPKSAVEPGTCPRHTASESSTRHSVQFLVAKINLNEKGDVTAL